MIYQERIRLTKLALALSIALSAAPAFAQNTTSAVGGRITAASGAPASGATVQVVHAESGTVSTVTTDAEGRYVARGLRVGGPYTIIITKDGISEKREGVYLNLAETAAVDATLGAPMQTVTVTGSAAKAEIFNRSNMGSVTNIGRAELESQASIQRNLQDFARIDPRVSQTDKDRGEMSVAGQNSRFNSMTIDGVNVNDTFGLEANGSPTARQPISIEAIQSVQVNVANYDVTQKGYTGANVNAVTKSGTNTWHGGVYYVTRDDRMVGKRYNPSADTYSDAPKFDENTKGIWVSGPLVKDKLFFYALNEEFRSSRAAPDFGPIGSSVGTTVGISQSTIKSVQDIARNKYGMDVGDMEVPSNNYMKSHEQMLKVDWNINDNHRANIRYQKTDQNEPIYPFFSQTGVTMSSTFYKQEKGIETLVAQLFSDWTPTFSTEFKASTRDYDSVPKNAARLPLMAIRINGPLPAGTPAGTSSADRFLNFGTENSRQRNELGTKTTDLYAGANWSLGDHEIKFGSDFNNNKIYNAFLQNVYGNYTFQCDNQWTYSFGSIDCSKATPAQIEAAALENFSRGRPSSYTLQTAAPGYSLEDSIAKFSIRDTGVFVQDTWSATKNLTLTYGVRLDVTSMGNKPVANTAFQQPMVPANVAAMKPQTGGFGYDNTRTIKGEKLWQPRVGFNYKFNSPRLMQLRGGIGLFQGNAMSVWMANPYQNQGVATRTITCSGTSSTKCPSTDGLFSPNPDAQQSVSGSAPKANVDLLAPGLTQPSIWKANLAFETELPWYGLVFGAEYLANKNKTGIYYEQLNLGAPTKAGSDGRELYWNANGLSASCYSYGNGSVSTVKGCSPTAKALSNVAYGNVLMVKNTSKGEGGVLTVSLTRPMTKGFAWSVAMSHTNATEVSPLTSSTSGSNYNGRSVFSPNEEVAANSAYLVKNRINALASWEHKFFGSFKTRFGMFYEGRTGKPFSWTYKNDLNGDGISGNDLMYIPKAMGSGEVVFFGDTATSHANEQRFWDIVNANKALRRAAGGVVGRNTGFTPWTNSIDLKISQEIPGVFKSHKGYVGIDFLNFGNLLNKRWGHINEVPFANGGGLPRGFVDYLGLDAQGRYVYGVRDQADSLQTRQNKGESQWAIQATVKYEF
jgi:Carboxypeptidase regulatory-like domain/TonB dependent receptor/TonB-dependent Receptor Plug Domain